MALHYWLQKWINNFWLVTTRAKHGSCFLHLVPQIQPVQPNPAVPQCRSALHHNTFFFPDFIPLSQRNLPASFFISNYQYPISSGGSSSFSSFAHDLYHHHAHHAAAAAAAADPYSGSPLLGADVDPWQNYMAAAAGSAYSAAHHRAGKVS